MTILKKCTGCETEYPVEHFNKKGSGRGTRCKVCVATYYRNYYQSNPSRREYIKKRNAENSKIAREKAEEIILRYFENGCVDCGNTDVRVLEFDHQGEKEFNVATLMNRNNMDRLVKEIEKCEVVCANCHRIRTAKQFDTWRHRAVYPHSDKV